jgi:plastocyanin
MRNNIFKKILPVACLTGVLGCLSIAVSAVAATTTVNVGQGGLVFVPANPSVNVGDTINFVWAGANHSSTSQPSSAFTWGSGVHSSPFTFPVTFTSAGSFPFECTVHVSFGMVGTVTVVGANQPPTVTITNPATGTVLSAPANVTVQASASDPDGTVTNVQFLITSGSGTVTFSNRITAPFSAATNNLPAGSYTLSAIAFDNLSATATNSVTISVVTPVTNILTQAQFQSHTNFTFSYSANVGLNYLIQRSSDLTSSAGWVSLATNKATANPATFTDTNAVANPAFYRVGLMPNP